MSDKITVDEIPEYINALGDNWQDGPWDRRLTQVKFIKHKRYSKWDGWSVGLYIDGEKCSTTVRVEDSGEIVLFGTGSRLAGQVQKYGRRVSLLLMLVSSEKFRDCLVGLQ